MAIARMRKFTLLTFAAYKDGLLKELQKFEDVHFRNLQADEMVESGFLSKDVSIESIDYNETELEKVKFAMSKIEPYVSKPKGLAALTSPPASLDYDAFDTYAGTYDYQSVYDTVQTQITGLNANKTEIAKLRSDNDNLRTWIKLDIDADELSRLKYVKCIIGTINKLSAENLKAALSESFPTAYVEFIGNIKDDITVLIIITGEEYEEAYGLCKSLGFSRVSLGFKGMPAKVIEENNKRIAELQAARNQAENKISELAGEYDKLKIVYDYYETVLEREWARRNFLKTDTSLVIEGWVPEDASVSFRQIVERVCGVDYYLEEEEVDKDSEEVPIKLKNNKMVAAFEGVTEMFSMPKYNDIDPTPLLMPFYMIFFGFMLGDAGYGLIMLASTVAALKFVPLKEGTKRFIKFFFYLSIATIFAGVIYGSAFGFAFFKPIQTADGTMKPIIDTQTDVILMMILSIGIGVVQLLFGILVKGYVLARNGKVLDAIFDSLFWFFAVASGLGWLLGVAGVISPAASSVSMWIFIASCVGLAATQGRSSPTLGGKIGNGLYGVYGISSYVGDLVSYTRIAALALSGAYIAFSFNLMAELIPAGIPRIIFGGLIFLFGLFLNIGLSALGAYVHTCRLQYVEYFGKFYEGGGVPFKAFKLKNKYITIKK